MPSLFKLGLATLASFASHAAAETIGPINIGPYKGITLTISKENTINSTNPINFVNGITSRSDVESIGNLRNRGVLEERQSQNPIFNFGVFPFGGGSTTVNAYISGIRQSDGAMVFVDKNGNWYIPKATPNQQTTIPANSITIPVPTNSKGAGFNVTLPGAIAGGRVSFVVNGTLAFFTNGGSNGVASIVMPSASASGDPSFNYFWGFSEFTFNGGGDLYMNPSAVDFAGCPNTFFIYNTTGKYVGGANGLEVDAATTMSKNLATQASKDGQPWDKLTVKNNKGQLVRVLSPNTYRGFDNKNGNAFNGYWEPYVNQVYAKYSNGNNLLLYTSAGTSSCSVTNNQLNCYGDNQGYPKPSSADIFSCNTGPFGNITQYNNQHQQNVPILCSAFVRSMLFVSGSQPAGPVSQYYQNTPTNWYSYYAHNASFSGVGYAFQFEEPTPAGAQEQSGTIHAQNAALVDFIIGGFGWGGYAPGQYA